MTNTEAKRPTPDTSPEAVERMAEWLYDLPCCHDSPQHTSERCKQCERTVAATLRALSAELEVERTSHTATLKDAQADHARAESAEAERDALKAELAEAVEVIIIAQALIDPCYPSQHGDWQRGARAFLARHQGNETTNQKETDT